MTDHDDDLVREALRAEAEGVHADGDLLDRIRAGARADRSPWRRHGPLLLAAAAVITLLVGLAVLLTGGDDDQSVDLVDDPDAPSNLDIEDVLPPPGESCAIDGGQVLLVYMSTTATDAEVAAMAAQLRVREDDGATPIESVRYVDRAEAFAAVQERRDGTSPELDSLTLERTPTYFVVSMPAGTDDVGLRSELADLPGVLGLGSVDCTAGSPSTDDPVGEPPAQAVAVTEQGRVVVIDTATGAVVRDLGGFDDPTDPEVANREGGAFSVTGVALHPNGRDVYVETCCEPAAGAVFRVPIDGSAPLGTADFEPFSFGYGIDISADGRWLAHVAAGTVSVLDLEGDGQPISLTGDDGTGEWIQAAVNADGTQVAAERTLERDADGNTIRSDVRLWTVADRTFDDPFVSEGRFVPLWVDGGRTLASVPAPGEELRDANVDANGAWILVVTDDGRLVGRSESAVEVPGGPYLAADW